MDLKTVFKNSQESMNKTIDKLKADLASVRTGRANAGIVEGIKVESYGSILPINQIAGISIPDGRTIEIKPWDISQLPAIEKAILKSDIGMTPINDGKIIRISVPPLTEDRRKEIAKSIGKTAEDYKIAIRNERRILIDAVKKAEKDKAINEDERKKQEISAQKLTDDYIKKIDESITLKEQEIMRV
ncbi:MAG: ribosome recycling factor [Elusimicrobiota bacterium]|jgi:ribosome recycling factor|nr:ribosome recycling factor [Elusimicrobiota bacterium]